MCVYFGGVTLVCGGLAKLQTNLQLSLQTKMGKYRVGISDFPWLSIVSIS